MYRKSSLNWRYFILFFMFFYFLSCASPNLKRPEYINKSINSERRIRKVEKNLDSLFAAALRGDEKVFFKLLKKGANPYIRGKRNENLLFYALKGNNLLIIKKSLELTDDLENIDDEGNTAFLTASRYCDKEVLNLLVKRGANIFAKNFSNQNALFMASLSGDLEKFVYLEKLNVPLYELDKNSESCLFAAVKSDNYELTDYLLNKKGYNYFLRNKNSETVMHYAVVSKNAEIFKLLFKKGLCIRDLKDLDGELLYKAAQSGNFEIVKFLIRHGVFVDKKFAGKTALMVAAQKNNVKIMKYLIENGANINERDDKLNTPLFYAIGYNSVKAALFLINAEKINLDLINFNHDTYLNVAVKNYSEKIVKALLQKGVDPEKVGSNKIKPVLLAAKNNARNILKLLIDYGASPYVKDKNGNNLLVISSLRGDKDIIGYLLSKGLNINEKNEEGMTPLLYAVLKNNFEVVKFLVENGADIGREISGRLFASILFDKGNFEMFRFMVQSKYNKNIEDISKCELLEFIYGDDWVKNDYKYEAQIYSLVNKSGNIDFVKFLIKKGFVFDSYDLDGSTPVYSALVLSNNELLKIYLENSDMDLNVKLPNGMTYLLKAVMLNNLDAVKLLVKHGANVKIQDKYGYSPLFTALSFKYWKIIDYLLDYEIDYSIRDNNGTPILILALYDGQWEIAKKLINKGADVNEQDLTTGITPLIGALSNKANLDFIKFLIDKGADIEKEDFYKANPFLYSFNCKDDVIEYMLSKKVKLKSSENGITPLSQSIFFNNKKYFDYFVNIKKFLNIRNSNGYSPLNLAVYYGYDYYVKKLLNNGAEIKTFNNLNESPLYIATYNGDFELVKLLARPSIIDAVTKDGITPLMTAIYYGYYDIAEYLIETGADINIESNLKSTAFLKASYSKSLDLLKLLVKKGANIRQKNSEGANAVNLAVYSDNINILTYLISLGLNVNNQKNDKTTPLIDAVKLNKEEFVRVLLKNNANPFLKDNKGKNAFDYSIEYKNNKIINLLKLYKDKVFD